MSTPVVEKKSRISPVWILPIVALIVGGWLWYKSYQDRGIDIVLHVDTATGITVEKTPVIFKGGKVGLVKGMSVTDDLQGVLLTIEMSKKAAPYLVEDTKFWVEKVSVEAGRVTGLDTLLSGAYIGMQLGNSDVQKRDYMALERSPAVAEDAPGLHLTLLSDELYSVQIGSGIYHKRFQIGSVQRVELIENDKVRMNVYIEPEFSYLVKEESRFWNASGITVKGGISDIKVHLTSLAALIRGGIVLDTPELVKNSPQANNGHSFKLYEDSDAASYGVGMSLEFSSAEGLREGSTKVIYRGMEVGTIETISLNKNDKHTVSAKVLIDPRAKTILNAGTRFFLIKPEVSLRGVRNIGTLVEGTYITFIPGEGKFQDHFVVNEEDQGSLYEKENSDGLFVRIKTDQLDSISVGSPILYKKIIVGEITAYTFREKEDDIVLRGVIKKKYGHLLSKASRFFNSSGVEVTANLDDGLKIQTGSLETVVAGGIGFYNPYKGGKAITEKTMFTLYDDYSAAEKRDLVAITVNFEDSTGLKKGMKVKYNNIEVGHVTEVTYSKDFEQVITRALIDPNAAGILLRSDSVFKMIRPEFSLAGTQHLDTLIQGAYLSVTPGKSENAAKEFTAVESMEAVAAGDSGLHVILETEDLFSLKVASPVYYRRIKVGEIVSYNLSDTYQKVLIHVRIDEAFKSIVREGTKFWNASGVHVSGGLLSGISVSTESLDSLLTGGISLATPDNEEMGEKVAAGHRFKLYDQQEDKWLEWSPDLGPSS